MQDDVSQRPIQSAASQYKNIILQKVKFENPPDILEQLCKSKSQQQSRPKQKQKQISQVDNSINLLEQNQVNQTQLYAQQNVMGDRVKSRQWDKRIQKDAEQIQQHMTDLPENMKSTYVIDDIPIRRLQNLKKNLNELINDKSPDFLFGSVDVSEKPIIDIDEIIQLNQVQQQISCDQFVINETQELDCIQQQPSHREIQPTNSIDDQENFKLNLVKSDLDLNQLYNNIQQINQINQHHITDFLDGNFEILQEGQALSELEVYATVFDQCIELLKKKDLSYEQRLKINDTLNNAKNYFINKAIRKSSKQKAFEEATYQLDKRVIIAEKDCQMAQQLYHDTQKKLNNANQELDYLRQQVIKLQYDIADLTKQKQKAENQQISQKRQLLQACNELRDSRAEVQQQNNKLKQYKTVIQRLQAVTDQTSQKYQISETIQVEMAQKIQKLEKREMHYKEQNDKQQVVVQNQEQQFEEYKINAEDQIRILNGKLSKYGESMGVDNYNKTVLNSCICNAMQTLIKLQQENIQQVLIQTGFSANDFEQLRIIFQHINESETAEQIINKFQSEILLQVSKHSKETQVQLILDHKKNYQRQIDQMQKQLNDQQKTQKTQVIYMKQQSNQENNLIEGESADQVTEMDSIKEKPMTKKSKTVNLSNSMLNQSLSKSNKSQVFKEQNKAHEMMNKIQNAINSIDTQQNDEQKKILQLQLKQSLLEKHKRSLREGSTTDERASLSEKLDEYSSSKMALDKLKKQKNVLQHNLQNGPKNNGLHKNDSNKSEEFKQLALSPDTQNMTNKSKSPHNQSQKQRNNNSNASINTNNYQQYTGTLRTSNKQAINKKQNFQMQPTQQKEYFDRFYKLGNDNNLEMDNLNLINHLKFDQLDENGKEFQIQKVFKQLLTKCTTQKNKNQIIQYYGKIISSNQSIQQFSNMLDKSDVDMGKLSIEQAKINIDKFIQNNQVIKQTEMSVLQYFKKSKQELDEEMQYIQTKENNSIRESILDISQAYETPNSNCRHVGTQINFFKTEFKYMKNKIDELTRLCKEHGIVSSLVDDCFQNGELVFDFSQRLDTEKVHKCKLTDLVSKQVRNQTIMEELRDDNQKDEKKDNVEHSSSFSVNSFIHDEQQKDDKLVKYVINKCQNAEIQVNTEMCEKGLQTDDNFDDIIYKSMKSVTSKSQLKQNEKPQENITDVDQINDLCGIQADDELQTLPLFNVNKQNINFLGDNMIGLSAVSQTVDQFKQISNQLYNDKTKQKNQLYNQNKSQLQSKSLQQDKEIQEQYKIRKNDQSMQLSSQDVSHYEYFLKSQSSNTNMICKSEQLAQSFVQPNMMNLLIKKQMSQIAKQQPQQQKLKISQIVNSKNIRNSNNVSEYIVGSIAQEVLNYNQSSNQITIKSDIPTYNDYIKQVTTYYNDYTKTVQKISRIISQSILDIHPRYGPTQLNTLQNCAEVPQIECFQIIHEIDKIYYKYNPYTSEKNERPIIFPCVVKKVPEQEFTNLNSQLHIATLKWFKYDISNYQLQNNGNTQKSMNNSKLNHLIKEKQNKAQNVPTESSLLPIQNEKISYVRLQSTTLSQQIPQIFRILEKYQKSQINIFMIENSTYLKIGMENVQLKTLTWITRLCRQILQDRISYTCSFLTANTKVLDNEAEQQFQVIQGQLSRQNAENLPSFVLYWAQKRYGQLSLVCCLIWNLIANCVYHQYASDEIYLFSRFLFGDLPNDIYLTYIDSFKISSIDLNCNMQLNQLEILTENVPLIVHSLLNNWESKRKYALIQNIYQIWFQFKQNDATMNFTNLQQIILLAAANYGRTVFQMQKLVFQKLNKGDPLSIKEFREYAEILVPQLSQNTTNEVFYAFSDGLNNENENINNKFMNIGKFMDMYQSMQLFRFAKVSSDILAHVTDSSVKTIMIQSANCFIRSKEAINDLINLISRYQIKNQSQFLQQIYKRIKSNMDLVQCDIMSYDAQGVIRAFKAIVGDVIEVLMLIKIEGCTVLISAFMVALKSFMERFYKDGSEDIRE